MDGYWIILDFLTLAGGVFLILAPDKAYNFGRKPPVEVPEGWAKKSRVIGIIFIIAAVVFIYFSNFA